MKKHSDFLEYTSLLYQLSQERTPEALEEMIAKLPRFREQIAWLTPMHNAPLLQLLQQLLDHPDEQTFFLRIAEILHPGIFLDTAEPDREMLLQQMIRLCPDSWLEELFRRYVMEMDMGVIGRRILDESLPIAYKSGKYRLCKQIFYISATEALPLDCEFLNGWHPLCFAARWNDPSLAQAYLDAMSELGTPEFGGSSLCTLPSLRPCADEEPLPDSYETTVLEEIALSGCREVMTLALRYGADPNARNDRGQTLKDVATDPKMRDLLEAQGGRRSNSRERLLFTACRAVQRCDPHAISFIEDVLEWDPPLFRLHCRNGISAADCRQVDLLLDCARYSCAQGIAQLYPAVSFLLDGEDHDMLLRCLFSRCFYGLHDRESDKPNRIIAVLQSLHRNGCRLEYQVDGQTPAQHFIWRLLMDARKYFSVSNLIDICTLLCWMCREEPMEVFLECQQQVLPDTPILPPEEAEAYFGYRATILGEVPF